MRVFITFIMAVAFHASYAQHNMHDMKDSAHSMHSMHSAEATSADTMGHQMNMQAPMSHAYSLNLLMNRNGSGTSWLPDASPMYSIMIHSKKWMYMIHGNVFLRYTKQDIGNKGSRGDDKFDAPNWFMVMAQRKVGKNGLFNYSVMLSLDPLTEGGAGYPLLFQTGESWKGKPLVDRQHPHDLFSGISVGYTQALSRKSDIFLYIGYPGEPALGSVAFMHRPSSLYGPDAPITHHWNDGTHITFGVATIGYRYDKFKLEASSFTGREPDENRYNFDKPLFDSWSARLSFNPSANWALQVSHGFIKSPEALHSSEDANRTTASVITSYPFGKSNSFNATALWGLNKTKGHDGENAALLEASAAINRFAVYMRYEWVQKSVEELNLDPTIYGNDALFPVNMVAIGTSYNLFETKFVNIAAGGQLSFYHADNKLNSLYGTNPISGQLFLRFYPSIMRISHQHNN